MADDQNNIRQKLADRKARLKKHGLGEGLSKEEQDKILARFKNQYEQLESAYEEERQRQAIVLRRKQELRRQKLEKIKKMKEMLDKKETAKLQQNMNKELIGILRGATMGITQDSELMKMLKKWVEGREKYHEIEQKKKMMNTQLDLSTDQLKNIILKLKLIDTNLREIKKLKKGKTVVKDNNSSDRIKGSSQSGRGDGLSSRNALQDKLQSKLKNRMQKTNSSAA